MRIIVSLLAIIFATGCATKSTPPAKTSEKPEPPRFSVNNMDRGADPRKDFARFAFGKWLDNTPIPADKARWGGFDELSQYNWRALKQILDSVANASNKANSPADKVATLFRSAVDTNKINELGLLPVQRDLARIEAIRTNDDLARTLAYLHNHGVGALFGISVRPDAKKSDVYALHASQGGLSLPSKDYYFEPRFENIRTSFVAHVTTMLKLAGVADEAAATEAKTIFEVEKSLAESSKAPVELRDALANYNKMPTAEFKSKLSAFPFNLYFAGAENRRAGCKGYYCWATKLL